MGTDARESATTRLPIGTVIRGIITVDGKRCTAEITVGVDATYGCTPEDHLLFVQQICHGGAKSESNPATEVILSDVSQPQMVEVAKIVHGTHFSIRELPAEQPQKSESGRLLGLIKSAIAGILSGYGRS